MVLFIALIMLVALSLAGIALMRQVGAGSIIAGNLTFKAAALSASDRGVEAARIWLTGSTSSALEQGSVANGYYAGWCNISLNASNVPDANSDGLADNCGASPPPSTFNPTSYNWTNSKQVTSDDGGGNEIRYVIHRMCQTVGSVNAANQLCLTVGSAGEGGSKGIGGYGSGLLANKVRPYFRITTRVVGPKNTIAYSQAIMY